jgi:hypothetical protein
LRSPSNSGQRAAPALNGSVGNDLKRTIAAPQHFVRYWSNSGQRWILARDGLSAFDPKRASLWRCIKRLDAYSITLSARESSVSGMLRPSA